MRASEIQLRQWMLGGLGGDAKDHASLLGALVPVLTAFYRRRMRGNEADIEDLVQETLIAVHVRRSTYDSDRPLTAWLFAIARYKMIDLFRRNHRYVPVESLDEILVSEGFGAASDARVDVERLLASLPEKQAQVIHDTRIEGLSTAETAEKRGLGQSDVKVSAHRGLKLLAKMFTKDDT